MSSPWNLYTQNNHKTPTKTNPMGELNTYKTCTAADKETISTRLTIFNTQENTPQGGPNHTQRTLTSHKKPTSIK